MNSRTKSNHISFMEIKNLIKNRTWPKLSQTTQLFCQTSGNVGSYTLDFTVS